jgi:transposase
VLWHDGTGLRCERTEARVEESDGGKPTGADNSRSGSTRIGHLAEKLTSLRCIAVPLLEPERRANARRSGSKSGSGQWSHWDDIGWVHYPEIGWSHSDEIRWVLSHEILQHGGGRRAAPENLPVLETIRIDLPAEQKAGLVWMRDEVSYEQDYQPSQFFRRQIIRPMYAHPRRAHGPLIAPMPARVIPQSMVGPGFLAHMLVGKYVDHVPYYRQERIDLRGGLYISDKARVRYTEHCALLLLTIYYQLIRRILDSGYVSVDETTVKLLDPDRPHKAQDSWLWTYLGPKAQAIVFQFGVTRGGENLQAFFPGNWRGQLQSDGYVVYESFGKQQPGIVLFGCWTHARRRAVDAIKSGAGEKALTLVEEINELYAIETEAKKRGYTSAQRGYYRYAKCRPVFKRLKARFEALKRDELPSSHLGDAAKYALNRWSELVRYAKPGYGHINIDQNPVESNIRPTKIGAKNWMHIGHPKAGWRSAVIYTVVGTCRLLKIDPQAYLTWVLPKLAAATTRDTSGLLPHDYARLHPLPNTS